MRYFLIILAALLFAGSSASAEDVRTTRGERLAIIEGNALFEKGEYAEALKHYQVAVKDNPQSVWALYNISLAKMKMAGSKNDKDSQKLLQEGIKGLENVSGLSGAYSTLASKASYNLGNSAFRKNDYASAISRYKDALRSDPSNDDARRNLRIAQLKQSENKDKKNDDKNKDKNKEKDKDKKDNKDKNDNNNNNDNKQQKKDNTPPPQQNINPQTANQILQAVENKENATRARILNRGQKQRNRPNRKNW